MSLLFLYDAPYIGSIGGKEKEINLSRSFVAVRDTSAEQSTPAVLHIAVIKRRQVEGETAKKKRKKR